MECWNSGMLVSKGIFFIYGFLNYSVKIHFINNPLSHLSITHYSIIPLLHYSNCNGAPQFTFFEQYSSLHNMAKRCYLGINRKPKFSI
jgi:hypothetical protein